MNTKALASYATVFAFGVMTGLFAERSFIDAPRPASMRGPASTSVANVSVQLPHLNLTPTGKPVSPQEAFSNVLAQPEGERTAAQLTAAFSRLLADSPVQAMQDVDRIPVDYRQQVLGAALVQLAAQQPDRVLEYMDGITDNYATHLGAVLAVIAQRDPRRAVEIAVQNEQRDPTGEIFKSLIPVLVHSNLEMAASAVSAMSEPPLTLIQQVASEYARSDPDRAYQWVSNVVRDDGRNSVHEAVDALSVSLALSQPDTAMNVLNHTQDATLRDSLIRAISQQMGQQDLLAAWTWLNQYRTDARYSENARNLLYRWSYTKPEEVAELLPSINDREIQAAVADELATVWQRKDPNAYRGWVNSLAPGSALRDGVARIE